MNLLPITIVIPTYNRSYDLQRTLLTIFDGEQLPSQIIVIDQSDNDVDLTANCNLAELLSNLHKTKIDYCRLKFRSSTASRNCGIQNADFDIVVFSDDDVDYSKDTLLNLFNGFDDKTGMIAGINLHYSEKRHFLSYFLGQSSIFHKKIGWVTKAIYGKYPKRRPRKKTKTVWAAGYFFGVRRDILLDNNLIFDEKMSGYAYAEDLDFSYRYYKICKNKKIRCYIDPEVVVDHRVSKSSRENFLLNISRQVINRRYLGFKLFKKTGLLHCKISDFFLQEYYFFRDRKKYNTIKYIRLFAKTNEKAIKNGELDHLIETIKKDYGHEIR